MHQFCSVAMTAILSELWRRPSEISDDLETCSRTPLSNRLRVLSRSEHRIEMQTFTCPSCPPRVPASAGAAQTERWGLAVAERWARARGRSGEEAAPWWRGAAALWAVPGCTWPRWVTSELFPADLRDSRSRENVLRSCSVQIVVNGGLNVRWQWGSVIPFVGEQRIGITWIGAARTPAGAEVTALQIASAHT